MGDRKGASLGLDSPTRLRKRKLPISNADLEHREVPYHAEGNTSPSNCVANVTGSRTAQLASGSQPTRVMVGERSLPASLDTGTRDMLSKAQSRRDQKLQNVAELFAMARQLQQERMECARGHAENSGNSQGKHRHAVLGLPVTKHHVKYDPQDYHNMNSDALSENKSEDQGEQKARLVWSQELHNRFLNALSHLGLQKAVPKTILTLMNVEGMTRENIASHLQKYRMYLKKMGGYSSKEKVSNEKLQELHEANVREMASREAIQQNISVMDELSAPPEKTVEQHSQEAVPAELPAGKVDHELPDVVEGIPISEPLQIPPSIHIRMYPGHQKEALCPAVAAVGGGHFDPQSWQYPELPAEDSVSSQAKGGDNHAELYNHLPVKHHDDQADIFFDGKLDNQSGSENADALQDELDEDLLIEKSTIHNHE